MLDFKIIHKPDTGEVVVVTSIRGKYLLKTPQLNKGTAFTMAERHKFGLLGKLPYKIETLDEQVHRAYLQFKSYNTLLQQNIYLTDLHDTNQILFYKLLSVYLNEMLPIIYTPIVGTAVQIFSHKYRQPRGLYISYSDMHSLDEIINNRSNPDIDLIVVTDGEGVLGIGDQGIGGMDIPVAKLMVYSLCGGIDPTKTLPIFIDVGTNNQNLLEDPLYLGCRHPRISGTQYDEFISLLVSAILRHFPNVFLHWEDLGRNNARNILDRFQYKLCTFNDDIQGTGVVTLAALIAACNVTKQSLADHRIIIFGAGSAGTGISDQITEALIRQGLSATAARERLWLIDRQGLLIQSDRNLTAAQQPYARTDAANMSLIDTIHYAKPSILIGCSAQTGAFSQEIIATMTLYCTQPIIFPLSNPDTQCEAKPADILQWSAGKALIATGTAFPDVLFNNKIVPIAQCNNALVFPGIGLGVIVVGAKHLSSNMLWAAVGALSAASPSRIHPELPLLPALEHAKFVARNIALAVAKEAIIEGLAQKNHDLDLKQAIDALFWEPQYLPLHYVLESELPTIE